MASWRDLSDPLGPSSSAPAPAPAPDGAGWRDSSSPLSRGTPPPPPPPPTNQPTASLLGNAPAESYDPNWKPSGNAFLDFMSRPRAKSEDVGRALYDATLAGLDYGTFGYGPGKLGLQDEAARAHANLGAMDAPVGALAYGVGPGKILGPVARGATALTGLGAEGAGLGARLSASALSGGAEGAASGGLGAAGHGGDTSDVVKGALTGAGIGSLTGAPGGMGPAPRAPEVGSSGTGSLPPTGMYAQKAAGYAPLDSIYFQGDHQAALTQAWRDLIAQRDPLGKGVDLGVSPEIQSAVNKIGSQPTVTGRGLQEASRDLRNSGDPVGHRFADALDGTLADAPPLPGSTVAGRAAQPGDAAAAKAVGDLWHGRIESLNRLGDNPDEVTGGAIKQTQQFYDPNSVEGQGLAGLAAVNKPSFNPYIARHIAAPLVGAAVGGAEGYFNAAEGQNPLVNAGMRAGENAALFSGLKFLAGKNPSSALNEARFRIATGAPTTTTPGRVGDMLSNILFGQLAGGNQPR